MARDYRDPYAFQPPSPTLTNPDMILPFNHSNFSALPSPPREERTSLLLENARDNDLTSYGYAGGRRTGYLSTKSPPPANHRLSSALSDIQEVETTPKRQLATPRSVDTLASSPTLRDTDHSSSHLSNWRNSRHERRSSDASSVQTDDLEKMKWPGFDSSGGIDEDIMGLDDEEEEKFDPFPKAADSDDTIDDSAHISDAQWLGQRPSNDDDDDDPLSKRADLILANAKKRLNVLEGNLRGARHSLLTAPSTSRPTPYLSQSVSGLRDRYSNGGNTNGHRARQYPASPLSSVSSFGHSRNQSETDLSPTPGAPVSRPPTHQKRATSALGSFAGGLSSLERSASLRGVRSQEVMRENRLQSWMKEAPLRQTSVEIQTPTTPAPHSAPRSAPHTATSATHSSPRSSSESVRPASALDLRTQMDELKGRISSLRERAQEDKIKRLSINSTRTPSPFSTAEQWYTEGDAYKNHALSTDAGIGWSPNSSPISAKGFPPMKTPKVDTKVIYLQESPTILEVENEHQFQDAEETLDDLEEESLKADEQAIRQFSRQQNAQDDSDSDEEDNDGESTGGESEYFESVPVIGERHEDRPDAFDYENFFLHSAMGSFTRERSGSFSSEDSIETTRPVSPKRPGTAFQVPQDEHVERSPNLHHRSQSLESISTVATFQTANEENSDSNSEDGTVELDKATSTYFPPKKTTLSNGNDFPRSGTRLDSGVQLPPATQRTTANGNVIANGTPSSPQTSHTANNGQRPISALVSLFLEIDSAAAPSPVLEQDRQLVKGTIKSLQEVCLSLQKHGGDDYERRAWRRRIDAARRALDGEFEAQAL